MIIAAQKKKENIVEYILYMYQIEDIIRSHNFDINEIEKNVISKFDVPDDIKEEMREWYIDLIKRMENEEIKEKGHFWFLKEIVENLNNLHKKLLNSIDELKYIKAYTESKPSLEEFREKSETGLNDIEVYLTGLYGLLIMRLKQENISKATEDAMAKFRDTMSILAEKYKSEFK